MNKVKIMDYQPEHQHYFEFFNRRWIEKYFEMEAMDEYVLTNPQEAIIERGGAILMATYEGHLAGTVALIKMDDTTYEFAKMAVHENFQRKGIAEALSYAAFKKAYESGAGKIILYTNSILKPAIRLYGKLGFQHEAVEHAGYKRANVKMGITMEQILKDTMFFTTTREITI
ncbi:MAG: GNAT family N-acetyltransferase [Sphingobacteriales bacterium]|nr:MAG: GNAT family N-acetyltransferase [Sphingobacteriales bacterium]